MTENKEPPSKINFLHYVVEVVAVIGIVFVTVAYMTVGGFETPIILAAIGTIAGIAAYDIHKKAGKQE